MRKVFFRLFAKISLYNRNRKYEEFLRILQPDSTTKVLDVGPSGEEDIASINLFEKKYPHRNNITALGVEDYSQFQQRYPGLKVVRYNGTTIPFKDKSFDICWCNAVIEHVGNRDAQAAFLTEMARVSRGVVFSTPNRKFFFEPHAKVFLLHYLPERIARLLPLRVRRRIPAKDSLHAFSFGELQDFLQKSGIASPFIIKNKLLGFTLDFMVVMR
ncbi:MAG: class I SAM-dependent methyltransferase [Candidatus Omnitrophota bacterium]